MFSSVQTIPHIRILSVIISFTPTAPCILLNL